MAEPSKHEKGLFRVMVAGTALSFGVLAAIIVSMQDFVGGNAVFQFSWRTAVAFVLGCIAGWAFWRLIRHWTYKAREKRER